MGWLIALGILTLLAILPLGVAVRYDKEGPLVRLIAGPVRYTLYPRKKKEEKPEKSPQTPKQEQVVQEEQSPPPPRKETPAPAPAEPSPEPEPAGGSITDFLPFVKLGLKLLGDFRRKLRVKRLELKLTLAGDDPCDLAVNYGRAWAAVGNLLPQLERFLVIKKRDVEVQCDFTSSETIVYARLDITITLGRLLALATVYGIRALCEFLKIRKKRKGGASK